MNLNIYMAIYLKKILIEFVYFLVTKKMLIRAKESLPWLTEHLRNKLRQKIAETKKRPKVLAVLYKSCIPKITFFGWFWVYGQNGTPISSFNFDTIQKMAPSPDAQNRFGARANASLHIKSKILVKDTKVDSCTAALQIADTRYWIVMLLFAFLSICSYLRYHTTL